MFLTKVVENIKTQSCK